MRRQSRRSLFVGLLLLTTLLAACGGSAGSASDTGLPNLAVASTRGADNSQRGLEPGQAAPDFTLQFPDGKKARLSDWQGQPVVLNFWASWCAPCKEEMPEFVAAAERYQEDGLVVVGINAGESASQAAPFMQQYGITFPVGLDERGDVQQLYNVRGLPTTVFIDREGRVTERWAGLLTANALEELLAEIR